MLPMRNTSIVNLPLLARLDKKYEKYVSFWDCETLGDLDFETSTAWNHVSQGLEAVRSGGIA
jgi:hypothetical protein